MFCLLVAAVIAASPVVSAQDLCISTTNTYTAVVDLFASELGTLRAPLRHQSIFNG
jgi:hypothetical protein